MNAAALKDALVSFLRVWVIGTVALFFPGLLGWINGVTEWARGQGATPFPDAHGLAYLFVAAITSGFVAAAAGILRYIENLSGKHLLPRAAGPEMRPRGGDARDPRGAVDLRTVAWVAVLVTIVVILVYLL